MVAVSADLIEAVDVLGLMAPRLWAWVVKVDEGLCEATTIQVEEHRI